jgi:hypothetical protein
MSSQYKFLSFPPFEPKWMRINPTNQPRLRASNPRIRGKWSKASGHIQIIKKLGGPLAPEEKRKTTTLVGEKRETKLPNERKTVNLKPPGKDHMTLPLGGVGSGPGATQFIILSYKQAFNVKITEKVSKLNPFVHTPLPITGGVSGLGMESRTTK